ncbi:alpha/beta fold hydrolase [bacterium]|nr:alpha/beta fold hydrolase [bacterium]
MPPKPRSDKQPAPYLPEAIARFVPDTRYILPLGEHLVHVMEAGEGRPVLMLHGNPTWSFLWRKVAREIEGKGVRAIMPDLVGLGYSDKPSDPAWHTIENHGQVIRDLVDKLDLNGLIFVGQDWGGPIGAYALATRADRVAGMVILNTVLGPPRPGFKPTAFHRFARVPGISEFVHKRLGFPMNVLAYAQGDKSSMRGLPSRAYKLPLASVSQRVAPLALARMVPDSLSHVSIPALETCRDFVKGFTGPEAIVWGDRDPVLGRAFKRVHELMPNAAVTHTQAGHFLQEEVPDAIANAILDVAARADAIDAERAPVTPPETNGDTDAPAGG